MLDTWQPAEERKMNPATKKETPSEIPDKRREGTRLALIEAGLELFGEYGFKATSTRMLAQNSGANVSAIPYYFGSKEGLYKAVIEHIVLRTTSYVGPAYEAIQKNRRNDALTRADARQALRTLIESIAAMFVDSDEPKSWALIIMREQARPTEAFDLFYNSMMKNVHGLMSALTAACAGLKPESAEAKIRAHTFLGQILVFLSSREVILRRLGVKKLSKRHVGLIHKVLWAHVEAALKVPGLDEGSRS